MDHAMMVKKHPTLGLMVRSDGLIHIPANHGNPGHWTYGSAGSRYPRIKFNGVIYLVHRIVAETFIPNPDGLPEVDHIDRNGFNNSIRNLHWVSKTENSLNRSSKYSEKIWTHRDIEDKTKRKKEYNRNYYIARKGD